MTLAIISLYLGLMILNWSWLRWEWWQHNGAVITVEWLRCPLPPGVSFKLAGSREVLTIVDCKEYPDTLIVKPYGVA